MKRGERVIVDIEHLTPRGDGVAFLEGRQVVAPRTVPGDRAEVYLRRRRRGGFEAIVDALLEPGVLRQDAPCHHFGLCGGCRWQDVGYTDQLQLKEGMVHDALERRGISVGEWRSIRASPDLFHYRNKMEFSFAADRDSGLRLGLHMRERYNRVFDLEACVLQSELSNVIVHSFRTHATRLRIPAYDLRTHQGILRFLVVRDAKATGQTMVNLVVTEYPSDGVDGLLAAVLTELGGDITTCVVTRNSGRAQVATGDAEFLVRGTGRIVEICGGIEFEISPQSFFQTNTRGAAVLYEVVGELAGDLSQADVLDLYSGTGGVALHLAVAARTVVGVECVTEAVADARRNAARNGIENCSFVADRAETMLEETGGRDGDRFDVVVADPPRAGIHRKAAAGLLRLGAPRILYVSCNVETLAKDLLVFAGGGYEVQCAQPLDLFPHTPHCEVVARLERPPLWKQPGDTQRSQV